VARQLLQSERFTEVNAKDKVNKKLLLMVTIQIDTVIVDSLQYGVTAFHNVTQCCGLDTMEMFLHCDKIDVNALTTVSY
jgi:hypothetical protein